MNNKVNHIPDGVEINWHGQNSCIEFGENCRFNGLYLDIYSNVKIKFEQGVEVRKPCNIQMLDDSEISVGEYVCFGMDGIEIFVGERSTINIGKKTHFNKNSLLLLSNNTELSIGEYSLFSRNVTIRTDDGHPIFDVETGERINSKGKRKVVVGDHVWLGQDVMLLYGADIGTGSIVGARSLIKGKFPNNCVIVGIANDAKVIRENVAWIRDDRGKGIDAVPVDYKQKTNWNDYIF